ncbi:MAG: hypothetical protein H0U27_05555 [Nitrosopumilus sp.]|nr:hypothetical protein [Nitrosopumilus sp.]
MSEKFTVKCRCCSVSEKISFGHKDYYVNGYKCRSCEEFIERLFRNKLEKNEIYEGYVLEVTYEITNEDHDGYCSDGYDFKDHNHTKILKLQVPKILTNDDFNDDNEIDLSNRKLLYFEPDMYSELFDELFSMCWGHNGYCGCKRYCNIISATMYEKKNNSKIILK